MKMEALFLSVTLVPTYQTTQCNNPEDHSELISEYVRQTQRYLLEL